MLAALRWEAFWWTCLRIGVLAVACVACEPAGQLFVGAKVLRAAEESGSRKGVRCRNGSCIPQSHVGDGEFDCPDGDDEWPGMLLFTLCLGFATLPCFFCVCVYGCIKGH